MKKTKSPLFVSSGKNAVLLFLFFFFSSNFCLSQEFIKGDGGCGLRLKPRGSGVEVKASSAHPTENEINYFSQGNFSTSSPIPEATDLTNLFIDISADASILYLSWNDNDAPFVISRSSDPSFQQDVEVIAKEIDATSIELSPRQNKILECFDVSGKSVVSYPAQAIGYDPDPLPSVPDISSDTLWWGDTLTINSNYLDPIAKANIMPMGDRYARADSVTTMGSYGVSADFEILDDSRGFYTLVQANGRLSDPTQSYPYIALSPRGYETVSGVKGISYAPQTGKVWIAGSGTLFELDLFRRDVENGKGVEITTFSNPLISTVSEDGRFVVVDGVSGADCVYQVDVSTGVMTVYASTKDDSFTRSIYPKGIGFAPDGSSCFIADGNNGKVVKVPVNAGPGSSTIRDNWGNRTFIFSAMPVGIDVNKGYNYVVVSSGDGYIYQITGQSSSSSLGSIGSVANGIEIDRDYSISNYSCFYYTEGYACAHCYNKNQVEENEPSFHGGTLFGNINNGFINLERDWSFVPYRDFPQKVILNNSNVSYPYPSPYQVSDRIIELKIHGWRDLPVKLKVIDPPDLSPYAPDGGWGGSSPHLPYEGNDNVGMADYGLCENSDCSTGAETIRTVTIGSDWTKKVYLKVPERYSGNNFQVQVEKTDYNGADLPELRIAATTPIYTTWKRVYVERDKMFRRGNLLDADVSAPPADQLYLLRWDATTPETDPMYVQAGEQIVVFDASHSYPDGAYEVASILSTPAPAFFDAPLPGGGTKCVLRVYLDRELVNEYCPSPLTFDSGESAAVGVVSNCDSASNQINASNSCFYDADMRAIEKTFNDGYVEFLGLRDGMGAVPYISDQLQGFYITQSGQDNQQPGRKMRYGFQRIWFSNFDIPNYVHLIGVRGPERSVSDVVGFSRQWSVYTFVHQETIEQYYSDLDLRLNFEKTVNNHELGHQFRVNICSGLHDTRPAWCNTDSPQYCPGEPCLMKADGGEPTNDIRKFCKEDLFLGDTVCGDGSGAVRQETDLVRSEEGE